MEDLVKIATDAALEALTGWSPDDKDAGSRLADAIGRAVAAGIRTHEESNARHIALTMAGLPDNSDQSLGNWQV